jgi:hypothetical protein
MTKEGRGDSGRVCVRGEGAISRPVQTTAQTLPFPLLISRPGDPAVWFSTGQHWAWLLLPVLPLAEHLGRGLPGTVLGVCTWQERLRCPQTAMLPQGLETCPTRRVHPA